MAALLLTSTLMTSCFKEKTDTSKQGLYVGIIGFNQDLHIKPLKILNESTQEDMIDFINGLSMESGTALYHAVNTALDKIEAVTPPEDLINVSIVTFTDGLDIGSYALNDNYNSGEEYLSAVHNRINTLTIGDNQIPISAYAIGVKGSDISDTIAFKQNLRKLSNNLDNVYEVDNMTQIGNIFAEIAQELYNQSYSYDVTLTTPALEQGMIRFTFDNIDSAEESQMYIQAMYTRENNQGILYEIQYVGLQCDDTNAIYATSDGMMDSFSFTNLYTEDGLEAPITSTKEWTWNQNYESWQRCSEFTPSGNTTKHEEFKSAMIMLVLDCSSSLGNDFQNLKNAANQFIRTLSGNVHQ